MKKTLLFAAIGEAATGLVLVAVPSLVGRLLLGQELVGVAVPVARLFGIALIALGVACSRDAMALGGMLVYSVLATGYLAWLYVEHEWVGPLLWPAVALHLVLTVLLGRAWIMRSRADGSNRPAREG